MPGIYKRENGIWYIRYSRNRKEVRKSLGTKDKREAQKIQREVEDMLRSKVYFVCRHQKPATLISFVKQRAKRFVRRSFSGCPNDRPYATRHKTQQAPQKSLTRNIKGYSYNKRHQTQQESKNRKR